MVLFNLFLIFKTQNLWFKINGVPNILLSSKSWNQHKKSKNIHTPCNSCDDHTIYIIQSEKRLFVCDFKYYATFKVRKFESLFYKINMCLQKVKICIGLPAEQILSVNIWYWSNFGRDFCCSMLFQEAPPTCDKEILKYFCYIVVLFVLTQKVHLFLKSYFKREILKICPSWCLF